MRTAALPADLAPTVARVRLLAEAAFLARLNSGSGFGDVAAPTQMHLHDRAASARLGRAAMRPSDTHRKAAAEVDAALAATPLPPADGRLAVLAARLALADHERALAALAIAHALDPDTRAFVQALAGRRKAALYLDVAAEIDPALAEAARLAAATAERAALVDGGLLHVGEDGGLHVTADRRLLAWVLADDRLPAPLDDVASPGSPDPVWLAPSLVARARELAARIAAAAVPVALLVEGPRGAGRRALAAAIAGHLGKPLLATDLRELFASEGKARGTLLRAFLTEVRLRDAVGFLAGAEALAGDRDVERAAIAILRRGPSPLVLAAGSGSVTSLPLDRPFHLVKMPRCDLDDRERAWTHSLAAVGAEVAPDVAGELAGRYVLGAGAIAEVAREAAGFAAARGGAIDRAPLEEAISRRLSIRLGAFGTLIARKARFEEMVLPEDVVDTLRDMIAMVRQRAQILERWGYQRHLGIARGVSGLFSGEPGTGKTMAASVVASELGLELMRIDLSQVVSKWVGETEKNLARIFDEAQDANAMLLFDEADALFGKRTEVKSAQDRYANLEVNYILQRMETFDGVSVLTTNFESSIDQALQRRLNFRIRFLEPELPERVQLWQKLLPPETGLADVAPFDKLAERFEMTGGYIKNAIVRAAVIAARERRSLTVDDLWTGAHHEYTEMGKVLSTHTRT
jgi:SpoVK/Ycf46/Vps4 family AAA+-type ATPase